MSISKSFFNSIRHIAVKLGGFTANIYVNFSVVHMHGPKLVKLESDEIALILVGRDISFFIKHHIQYHLKLGISHIVYIDNGSSDDSIEIAKSFDNITIARCSANFRVHQSRIRHLANTKFISGGWRLAIDPDELLDYPGMNRIDLPELTRRLSARGHTAMVAQMLEMVCDGPISATDGIEFSKAEQKFDRFSLTDIKEVSYHNSNLEISWFLDQNMISNSDIHILYGGLRHAAFGENCCLTKHALFRMGKGVGPHAHPHVTTGVTCTDFSAVLRHYKFAGGMLARERKLLSDNRIAHEETRLRVSKIDCQGDMNFNGYAECENPSIENLLDKGFLKASKAALKMLE